MDEKNDNLIDIIKKIIIEFKRIIVLDTETIRLEYIKKAGGPTIPSLLNGVLITPKFEEHITELQKAFRKEIDNFEKIYQNSEFRKLLRNRIGSTFDSLNLDKEDNDNAKEILNMLNDAIKENGENSESIEHTFGCTLSEAMSDIPKFSMGQVSFQTRLSWLENKYINKSISYTIYIHVKRIWEGEKFDKIEKNSDAWYADSIVDTIGEANFLCSVTVKGFSLERGKEKSLMIARLALTVLSLIWERPSEALNGFRLIYDGPTYLRHSISFSESGRINSSNGISHNFPKRIHHDSWENVLKNYEKNFKMAGDVFDYFLNYSETHVRKKLFISLLHALIWMHAGCSEENKLIAIVKFAACLDSLVGDKDYAEGIKKLIEKQMGAYPKDILFVSDSITAEGIVREIYTKCRSETIHGSNKRIDNDWSTTRDRAELLCRNLLVNCLFAAAEDESLKYPKQFYQ